jgi:hypothetical protein
VTARAAFTEAWLRVGLTRSANPGCCIHNNEREMHLKDAVVLALVVGLVVHGHGDCAAAAAHHAAAVAGVGHLACIGTKQLNVLGL